jgi:hypothetical protein
MMMGLFTLTRTYSWTTLKPVKNIRICCVRLVTCWFYSDIGNTRGMNQLKIRTALFWNVMQRGFVIFYRSLVTTYEFDSWPVKMGPIGCSETSVRIYHYSLRNNPQEPSSHILRGASLKARNLRLFSACSTLQFLARIIMILRPF